MQYIVKSGNVYLTVLSLGYETMLGWCTNQRMAIRFNSIVTANMSLDVYPGAKGRVVKLVPRRKK